MISVKLFTSNVHMQCENGAPFSDEWLTIIGTQAYQRFLEEGRGAWVFDCQDWSGDKEKLEGWYYSLEDVSAAGSEVPVVLRNTLEMAIEDYDPNYSCVVSLPMPYLTCFTVTWMSPLKKADQEVVEVSDRILTQRLR